MDGWMDGWINGCMDATPDKLQALLFYVPSKAVRLPVIVVVVVVFVFVLCFSYKTSKTHKTQNQNQTSFQKNHKKLQKNSRNSLKSQVLHTCKTTENFLKTPKKPYKSPPTKPYKSPTKNP